MPFITFAITGIAEAQARIAAIRAALPMALADALTDVGDAVTADLQARAPVGADDDDSQPAAAGDQAGRLRDSFVQDVTQASDTHASLVVRTTQPQKLAWVVDGRGDVYPVNKKALFWKAQGHPVMHAGPSKPNDFVSPVLDQVPEYAQQAFDTAITAAIEES